MVRFSRTWTPLRDACLLVGMVDSRKEKFASVGIRCRQEGGRDPRGSCTGDRRPVNKREGCWSTKHTKEERDRARTQYFAECDEFAAYMCESEGNEEDDAEDSEIGDEENAQAWLCQQSFMHQITGEDIYTADSAGMPSAS